MSAMKRAFVVMVLSITALAQHQLAELTIPGGQAYDQLGYRVAVAGNILAVISGTGEGGFGSISLFQSSGNNWGKATYLATLTIPEGATLASLSIGDDGAVVVVGAPQETVGGNVSQGAAYVFVEPATGWVDATETARLIASNGSANDSLGSSVSVNADEIVAGAPGVGGMGAAYVFKEPKGGWVSGSETAILTASNGAHGDVFGNAVSVNGPRIAVGAMNVQYGGNQGAVYVYQEPIGGWTDMTETAELTASGDYVRLGATVVDVGNTISTRYTTNLSAPFGAYVYVEPPGGWVSTEVPTAIITANESRGNGGPVALTSDAILIGDTELGWTKRHDFGGAYEFTKPAGGWVNSDDGTKMVPNIGSEGMQAGLSVAQQGTIAFLGAPQATVGKNVKQGAVFVFSVK